MEVNKQETEQSLNQQDVEQLIGNKELQLQYYIKEYNRLVMENQNLREQLKNQEA